MVNSYEVAPNIQAFQLLLEFMTWQIYQKVPRTYLEPSLLFFCKYDKIYFRKEMHPDSNLRVTCAVDVR